MGREQFLQPFHERGGRIPGGRRRDMESAEFVRSSEKYAVRPAFLPGPGVARTEFEGLGGTEITIK